MRLAIATTLMLLTVPAWAGPPSLKQMTDLHDRLDNMCRGWSGDDPHTGETCDLREQVSKLIRAMGYCVKYPQYTWHHC